MKPKISIIVPVYNIESYINKCLDSILQQAFKDFEVIVVNDGSTDNSGFICEEYAQRDKRIKVIHRKNGGLSSARNAGIKIAQGEFLGFVDGDDWINKDMYQKLYELCLETGSEIAICSMLREINGKVGEEKKSKEYIKVMNNEEAMKQLFTGNLYRFTVCSKLFKRNCFNNILFPEGRIHEDLSTTYRVFSNAKTVVFSSYTGYVYVKRESSILTTKFNEKRLEAFLGWDEVITFMNKHYPQLSREYISCFVYWSIDNVYYILNQVGEKKERDRYILFIQEYVRKYYRNILMNESLPIKYKYLITLLTLNHKFLYANDKFNKRIKPST